MTWTLVRKLLRDLRVALIVVAFLLGAFQCLWYRITDRIIGQLAPFFNTLAGLGGMTQKDLEGILFEGPGQIVRTIIGGEKLDLSNVMDMLSIGYVHPLMQTIFCIWAVGRAAGAIAGELDRGTMELLLAQPIARARLVLAHLWVDLLTIPVLCLSLWAGTCLGYLLVGPVQVRKPEFKVLPQRPQYIIELGPFKLRVASPLDLEGKTTPSSPEAAERSRKRLEVRLLDFSRALPAVAGLIFAITGYTMWLSAAGRFRWRVLGFAVLITLLQFLVNVIGQLWDLAGHLRPLTIFYYYQPQEMITATEWTQAQIVRLLVLYGVGITGYLMALRTFTRRDLPAPL
jgi:beta-exotoxin I transport system permease protein